MILTSNLRVRSPVLPVSPALSEPARSMKVIFPPGPSSPSSRCRRICRIACERELSTLASVAAVLLASWPRRIASISSCPYHRPMSELLASWPRIIAFISTCLCYSRMRHSLHHLVSIKVVRMSARAWYPFSLRAGDLSWTTSSCRLQSRKVTFQAVRD